MKQLFRIMKKTSNDTLKSLKRLVKQIKSKIAMEYGDWPYVLDTKHREKKVYFINIIIIPSCI